jgi:acyl-CoA synthetase (AMP-forming)/AMP-acid ligase II
MVGLTASIPVVPTPLAGPELPKTATGNIQRFKLREMEKVLTWAVTAP